MGNILSNAVSNQQTVRIMTSQPALTPARTINSQQQHRIVSVSCLILPSKYHCVIQSKVYKAGNMTLALISGCLKIN